MAITKIAGELLESNLIRTTDLAFNTNLLVVDVDNGRIGVGTATPGNFKLDVVGNTRITGNQTITGDLTVQGNTTTIDSTNLSIEDNMIVLNSSGSIGNDSGLMINRGAAGNNAVFFWDEDADTFKFGTTATSDGSTQTDFGGATLATIQAASVVLDNTTAPSTDATLANKKYVDDSVSGLASSGGTLNLGLPTDSSFGDGAYTLNTSGTVTDAIDDLNEVQENIRADYYVKSVSFTADTTAAGSGATITLTISTVGGGADRYTITWGDSNTTTGTADSTPSHTYTATGSMSVTVKAYANGAVTDSAGSHASVTRSSYITIYTATPVADFELYDVSSGGSALTGNNLWVVEGQTRYMKNLTTNTLAGAATVAYDMNWGDGTADETIGDGAVAGGSQEDSGTYLSHTWGAGTHSSTGQDTLILELDTHSTANPADIPATETKSNFLKVYDDAPAAPNHLGSKTIAMNATTGTSPKLCSGFTENVSGSPTYSAGDSVNRITTVDPVRTASQSTFCYNADSGTLTAYVNGSADGAISLSGSDNSGTATSCTIESESDYNLLNATGAAVSFANSIYHPSLYKGFKAIVSKATSGISTGVNSFQLQHTLGNTNDLEFVKDDVTSAPTVSSAGTLTEGTAGTYRYISGIPYYSQDGSAPSLNLTGVTVTNLTGQCYSNVANPVEVDYDTQLESGGQTGSAIDNEDYTYANIDGASTMLSSGVPIANVGVGGAYTLGTLAIPTQDGASAISINEIKIMARNCNGTSAYNTTNSTKIQVFNDPSPSTSTTRLNDENASLSGGIAVSDSLGATFDDDAVRIAGFGALASDNPSLFDSSNANYYTDSAWSGAITVAGTNEAITRWGTISYFTTDLSSGYLPAGPDLNTGRNGGQKQYYTFAFRRTGITQFNLTMSGKVSGMWLNLPGSALDTTASPTNGWINCSVQYDGAGNPGTGVGGNGSAGCAYDGGDVVADGTTYSNQEFTFTFGEVNLSTATGNNCLVRILLNSDDSITALEID